MDSNRIKKLATGVRASLITEVSARLDRVLVEGSPERLDMPNEVKSIEAAINERGREKVVEANAYTWFNRLCALRFMDANGYTPVGIVSPKGNNTQPEILADAMQGVFDSDLGFDRLVRDRVTGLISGSIPSANPMEAAYETILTTVCKHYANPMPYLFKDGGDASRLLMPQGLLSQDSLLRRIVAEMDEESCKSVEVLGWLYQFYIAEKKDEVFASKKKRGAAEIPAATQLFTPNWIVRYMTENSLGRLWMLNNPGSSLKETMDYYIEGETPSSFLKVYSPEEITVLDPACGSGHILVYAFDLLYSIYEEEGYLPEDIPTMILAKNLFGFEIDQRAAEIAKFALEMKARAKDAKFFERCIDANITVLDPIRFSEGELEEAGMLAEHTELLEAFAHLDEIGSLYIPGLSDNIFIDNAISNIQQQGGMYAEATVSLLQQMKTINEKLSRKFSVVIANPPYMPVSSMEPWAKKWIGLYYPNSKEDVCTCFIERGFEFSQEESFLAMVTMHSWMSLKRYQNLRMDLFANRAISSLAHLGAKAFEAIGGEVVQTVAFVFESTPSDKPGVFIRLVDVKDVEAKRRLLVEAAHNRDSDIRFETPIGRMLEMPESILAYQASQAVENAFANGTPLGDLGEARQGAATGCNERFVRMWWEVSSDDFMTDASSIEEALSSGKKWFPFNKGGSFRKWYGNNDCVIAFDQDSFDELALMGNHLPSRDFYFKPSITWSKIASGTLSMRMKPTGHIFSDAGMCIFGDERKLKLMQGFLNSSSVDPFARIASPTLHFEKGQVALYPVLDTGEQAAAIIEYVDQNIDLATKDWDSFEVSWDFKNHPLHPQVGQSNESIEEIFATWETECMMRFDNVKSNEEKLNRVYAQVYDMKGEVPIEVPNDKVSVRLADKERDIKSLISYGIGCVFGRYSIDKPGLILANQGSTVSDFNAKVPSASFSIDEDGILPVLDGEWFEDDIVVEFKNWLETTYGSETLQANIAFIEDALGEDLRTYFVKHFYDDHVKTYQKRPIYWLFSSPKKSFNVLVYLHRYDEGTVGDILTGYLRDYISKLNASIASLETSDRAADQKQADKYRNVVKELEEWERDVIYPMAHERISIDLDDGVKVNYNKFPHALRKITGLSEWK